VANWGHIGDVLLTLPAIADLRRNYPDAQIGMIAGSWGKPAALGSGLINTVHVVDHWALNRLPESKTTKFRRFLKTRADATAELKSMGYQVGVDFYPFFPPAHPLFLRASIPIRIGFDSGGLGPLLTHSHPWRDSDRSVTDYCRDILHDLLPTETPPRNAVWSYPQDSSAGRTNASNPRNYIVVHPGAGAAFKDWGEKNWQTLVLTLRASGADIVITGSGAEETALADRLASLKNGIVSLSGRTTWEGFVRVIANADAVICPDSAAAHVAAFFHTPTVAIFTGTNNPKMWAPRNPNARVLYKAVVCAPCHRAGCRAMACIRGVTVDEVLDVLRTLQKTRLRDVN
jgi:ADP-heptose:LPS heptosyltransferase